MEYRFESAEFKREFIAALETLGACLDIEGTFEEADEESLETASFRRDTPVEFQVPDSEEYDLSLPASELIRWASILQNGTFIDRSILIWPGGVLALIEARNEVASNFEYGTSQGVDLSVQQVWNGHSITTRIVQGLTPFALAVVRAGGSDELNPPFRDSTCYVEISCTSDPTLRFDALEATTLVEGFLFEVASEYDLFFTVSSEVDIRDCQLEPWNSPCGTTNPRVRPIDTSRGMADLHKLYLDSLSTWTPAFQVIGLVKVIEFVSSTVERSERDDRLRLLLSEPGALNPGPDFLERISEAVQSNARNFGSDKPAFIRAIRTCCDPISLGPKAPTNLVRLGQINPASDNKARKAALQELAECLLDTRNDYAHSKANYSKTGKECPPEHVAQLVECSRLAAIQCIRWFANLREDIRVV